MPTIAGCAGDLEVWTPGDPVKERAQAFIYEYFFLRTIAQPYPVRHDDDVVLTPYPVSLLESRLLWAADRRSAIAERIARFVHRKDGTVNFEGTKDLAAELMVDFLYRRIFNHPAGGKTNLYGALSARSSRAPTPWPDDASIAFILGGKQHYDMAKNPPGLWRIIASKYSKASGASDDAWCLSSPVAIVSEPDDHDPSTPSNEPKSTDTPPHLAIDIDRAVAKMLDHLCTRISPLARQILRQLLCGPHAATRSWPLGDFDGLLKKKGAVTMIASCEPSEAAFNVSGIVRLFSVTREQVELSLREILDAFDTCPHPGPEMGEFVVPSLRAELLRLL